MKKVEKSIISNTAYTMGGAILLNGVLQLIIYPLLNRYMGDEQMGEMLYIMGLVAILCPSVGQALNTSRLVARRSYAVTNGDYDVLLLLFGGAGTAVALGAGVCSGSLESVSHMALTALLLMATCFRYYGDVEYRLSLDYRAYFRYYGVLSAGYILGLGLYLLTKNWYAVFVLGEAAALVYVALTGNVFRSFFCCSGDFRVAFQRGGFLVFSYLITNLTLNMDRLVLKNIMGNTAVTQYYVASLIGKVLVLLVAPVNTIMISYLTRRKENLNRKQFSVLAGAGVLAALGFFLCAQIGTPVFIRLFYGKDMYLAVKDVIALVNIGQILSMLSAYLFMVVLSFTGEKWQLILQIGHMVLMTVLVLDFTGKHGIVGFAAASLIANALRVLAVLALGFVKASGKLRNIEEG